MSGRSYVIRSVENFTLISDLKAEKQKGQRSTFLMRMEIVNQVAKRQKKKKTYFMRGEIFL